MPFEFLRVALASSLLSCFFFGVSFASESAVSASPAVTAYAEEPGTISSVEPEEAVRKEEERRTLNAADLEKERADGAATGNVSGSFPAAVIATDNSSGGSSELPVNKYSDAAAPGGESKAAGAHLLFAGEAGVGVTAAERMFIDKSKASISGNFVPYGRFRLRFGNGGFLRPEIIIEESGSFKFDRSGIRNGNSSGSYGYYYLKIPLGFHVPFFSYRSAVSADASYQISEIGIKIENRTLVNNEFYDGGSKFKAVSSEMLYRLYLNTPVVKNPNFFEYSYFGFFYSEKILPRTTFAPSNTLNYHDMLVSTNVRSGGIFYDMRKDTLLRGLNFDVAVYVGYGNIEIMDSVSQASAEFGNLDDILSISARGGLGYRYMFGKNFGAAFNVGVSYFATTEFLSTADDAKYGVNTGGDLRYYAALNFIFGY